MVSVLKDHSILIKCRTIQLSLPFHLHDGEKMDVGTWPKSKLIISPRIGFNWDVKGDRSLQIRGGSGLFTGLLPFVWFTNQPTNSGLLQVPEIGWGPGNANLTGLAFNPDYKAYIASRPDLFPQSARNFTKRVITCPGCQKL